MGIRRFHSATLPLAVLGFAALCGGCDSSEAKQTPPPSISNVATSQPKTTLIGFLNATRNNRVIAHRGASGEAPENTLAAFRRAMRSSADIIEVDVRLTRDGRLVCMHDASVRRTTDGDGLVHDLTLDEIKALDAGSWFDPSFVSERVPTLREALDLMGGTHFVNIEIKTSPATDDMTPVVNKVVELLRDRELLGDAMISSADPNVLAAARRLEPALPTAAILNRRSLESRSFEQVIELAAPNALYFQRSILTSELAEQALATGLPVFVYVVNDMPTVKELRRMGIRNYITDWPNLLRTKTTAPTKKKKKK